MAAVNGGLPVLNMAEATGRRCEKMMSNCRAQQGGTGDASNSFNFINFFRI